MYSKGTTVLTRDFLDDLKAFFFPHSSDSKEQTQNYFLPAGNLILNGSDVAALNAQCYIPLKNRTISLLMAFLLEKKNSLLLRIHSDGWKRRRAVLRLPSGHTFFSLRSLLLRICQRKFFKRREVFRAGKSFKLSPRPGVLAKLPKVSAEGKAIGDAGEKRGILRWKLAFFMDLSNQPSHSHLESIPQRPNIFNIN